MWGGFPPASSGDPAKDAATGSPTCCPAASWPMRTGNMSRSGGRCATSPTSCYYSDVRRDVAGAVARIASWLGVELTDDERASRREVRLQHMKAHPGDSCTSCRSTRVRLARHHRPAHPGSMTRKGVDGDGKATFTAEQAARWAAAEETEFADAELREWARRGRGRLVLSGVRLLSVLMQRIRRRPTGGCGRCSTLSRCSRGSVGSTAAGCQRARSPAGGGRRAAAAARGRPRGWGSVELVHRVQKVLERRVQVAVGLRHVADVLVVRVVDVAVDAEELPRDRLHPRLEVGGNSAPRAVGKAPRR